MSNRELAAKLVEEMPDDGSLEELVERLRFVAAVREGLDAVERGEGRTLEQVRAEIESWPDK